MITEEDMEIAVDLGWIQVVGRHRQDLGEVDSLARSIKDIGLINPITVTSDGRLVAGQRRLEAARRLGWEKIPARIVESLDGAVARLTAERDENTERKAMTPEELARLGLALEELERPRAKERQGQRTDLATSSPQEEEVSERARRPTDDVVGKALGVGSTTYYRAKAVVKAAEDDATPPEVRQVAQAALADMNTTGNISGNYEKVRKAKTGGRPKSEGITRAGQQRKSITNAVHTLSGMSHGLALIDPIHPDITDEEAAQWVDGLSEARRILEALIKRLRAHTQGGA